MQNLKLYIKRATESQMVPRTEHGTGDGMGGTSETLVEESGCLGGGCVVKMMRA